MTWKREEFDLGLSVARDGIADRNDALILELVRTQAVQREGREGGEAGQRLVGGKKTAAQ